MFCPRVLDVLFLLPFSHIQTVSHTTKSSFMMDSIHWNSLCPTPGFQPLSSEYIWQTPHTLYISTRVLFLLCYFKIPSSKQTFPFCFILIQIWNPPYVLIFPLYNFFQLLILKISPFQILCFGQASFAGFTSGLCTHPSDIFLFKGIFLALISMEFLNIIVKINGRRYLKTCRYYVRYCYKIV